MTAFKMSYQTIQKEDQNIILLDSQVNKFKLRTVLNIVKNKKGKLLDVGCNDGKFLTHFIKRNFQAEGIDISRKAIRLGKKRGLNIKRADITKRLPYADNTFDVIFCGEVLEHLLDPIRTVQEIYRILKKNGSIIITVPNAGMLRNLFLILLGKPLAYSCTFDGPHYRDFCEREAIRILKNANFRKIKVYGDMINIPYWKNKLIRINPVIPRFCDNLILKAIK